jgi:cell division protein FtsI/penicillin-binding protein 2
LPTQQLTSDALRAAMTQHGASVGAVMVVDVASAEVCALVSVERAGI